MQVPEVGEGIAFGIGGTSYRVAMCDAEGNIDDTFITPTPQTPEEFFSETARRILRAADDGATWAVVGIPGPVITDVNAVEGRVTQNMRVTNIKALSRKTGFDPVKEMIKADSAIGELFESDSAFTYLTDNDGNLASQAGAKLFGITPTKAYDVVADIIVGTGVGGAMARRDPRFPGKNLFHPDLGLWEIGHIPKLSGFPTDTYEATISGPALEKRTRIPADQLSPDHPIWANVVGPRIGDLVVNFALNGGAELVVISSGVGSKAQKSYDHSMRRMLRDFVLSNNPMADKLPEVLCVPEDLADTYELYGARGAIVSHLTRMTIDKLVLTS